MRIITISREFGSGGRALGKRMADILGFDYYDKEIISAIAKNKGLEEHYVESILENHGWKTFPLTFHSSIAGISAISSISAGLLVEQKKVINQIAGHGKDFIIVGRSADVILQDQKPFNIFVCADKDSKIKRCLARTSGSEQLSEKKLIREMERIDKNRMLTREIISDRKWGDRSGYQLTVNTTDWDIKDLAYAISDYALCYFEKRK